MVEQIVQPAPPQGGLPEPAAREADDDGMVGAGIHRGDWLLFELTGETSYATEDGELIVIWHGRYFVPHTFRRFADYVEARFNRA